MAGITDFIRELIRPTCDINNDGKLDTKVEKDGTTYDEVSIFNHACESYNEEEQTIEIFENGNWKKWNIENLVETIRTTKKELFEKLEALYGKYNSSVKTRIPQISAEQAEKIEKAIKDKSVEKADATYVVAKEEAEQAAEIENITEKHLEPLPKLEKTSQIKFPEQDIDEKLLNQAFDNVVKDLMKKGGKKKSVILGMGSTYLNHAKERNLDPFVLMGVSMIESSYGTSDWALKKNNVCGVHAKCATVADSIRIGSDVLQKNVYNKNLQTVHSIGTKGNYCGADSATRARWVKNTTFFANKVIDEYNRLLNQRNIDKSNPNE